ncbi:hypothetical protein [Rhizobium sp. No.120]
MAIARQEIAWKQPEAPIMPRRGRLLRRCGEKDTDGTIDDQNQDQGRQQIEHGQYEERYHRIAPKLPAKHERQRAATIAAAAISRSSMSLRPIAKLP